MSEPFTEVPARTPTRFRPVRGLGRTAIGLFSAALVLHLATLVTDWQIYRIIDKHAGLDSVPYERYADAYNAYVDDHNSWVLLNNIVAIVGLLAAAAGAIVFLVWIWKARRNAEYLCAAKHRLPRAFTVASWMIPLFGVILAPMVLDDIGRASSPKTPPRAPKLRANVITALAVLWIVLQIPAVLSLMLGTIARNNARRLVDPDVAIAGMAFTGVGLILLTGATVAFMVAIAKIGNWQTMRAATPWYAPAAAMPGQHAPAR
mgnify:CR=1 FL=1